MKEWNGTDADLEMTEGNQVNYTGADADIMPIDQKTGQPITHDIEALAQKYGEPTALDAGIFGAASGLTMGWNDEIAGGLRVLFEDLEDNPDASMTEQYIAFRDQEREKQRLVQDRYPWLTTGSEVAANVVTLPRAVGMAGLKGLAAMGGAYGAGTSEADTPMGVAGDAAIGAATTTAGGHVLGKAMQHGGNAVKNGITKPTDWIAKKAKETFGADPRITELMDKLPESAKKHLREMYKRNPKSALDIAARAFGNVASGGGAIAGELTGGAIAKAGKGIQSISHFLDNPVELFAKIKGTPFEPQLRQAMQKGQDSFRATLFVFAHQPNFRSAVGLTDEDE